jgi:hypothetical protein
MAYTFNPFTSNFDAVGSGQGEELVAPVPTYNLNGILTEINYNSGYRKVFGYDLAGYLTTVDFYQPNKPTQRRTLSWLNGVWQGTSAPVVVS